MTQTEVSQLYVSLLGRASEKEGNDFWQGAYATQLEGAEAMLGSQAVATYFGGSSVLSSSSAFVEHIYANTLNKTRDGANGTEADAAGIDYWIGRLDGTIEGQSKMTQAEMIVTFIEIAQASTTNAGTQFSNRVEVSNAAANDVATAPADYQTSMAFQNSGSTGLVVTHEASTKDAAIASFTAGATLALTTDTADILSGTSKDDTFTGDSTTIQSGDLIIDSSSTDNDTFNMTLTGGNAALRVSGVENVNVDWDAFGTAAIDATNITGATITATSSKTGFQGSLTTTGSGANTIVAGTGMDGTLTVNGVTTGTVMGGEATNIIVASAASTDSDTTTVTAGSNTTNVTVQDFNSMTVDAGTATTIQLDDDDVNSDDEETASLTFGANATLTNNVDDLTVTASASDLTLTLVASSAVDASLDIAGSENMTLAVATQADLNTETVTKSSTGDLTVAIADIAAAGDLSKVAADLITVAAASAGGALTVTSGSAVKVTSDLASAYGLTVSGTGTSDIATLTLDTNQQSIITFTGIETTTINANATVDATDGVVDLTIQEINAGTDKVVLSGENDVTITLLEAGELDATALTNNLIVTEDADLAQNISGGTANNTVVFKGTDKENNFVGQDGDDTVTFATTTGVAVAVLGGGTNNVTANAFTGIINDSTSSLTVVGGTGDDTVSATGAIVGNVALELGDGKNEVSLGAGAAGGNITIVTGTGNDTINLGGSTNATQTLNITLGEGTDTLELAANADISAGTQTISGLDAIKMTGGGAGNTVAASLVSGNSISVTATATAGDILTVAATSTTGGETIDLSSLVMSQNISTAVISTAINGTSSDDIITGTSIADAINGGNGKDTIIFADTAANNGIDVFGTNFIVADDKMNFKNFLSGGEFNATVIEHNGTGDVNITNKVSLLAAADGGVSEVDTGAKVAALIESAGNAMALTSGGKAILIAGDDSAATAGANIWYIDDSLGATTGTIEADDIVSVGTIQIDIDTITAANIEFA